MIVEIFLTSLYCKFPKYAVMWERIKSVQRCKQLSNIISPNALVLNKYTVNIQGHALTQLKVSIDQALLSIHTTFSSTITEQRSVLLYRKKKSSPTTWSMVRINSVTIKTKPQSETVQLHTQELSISVADRKKAKTLKTHYQAAASIDRGGLFDRSVGR